MLLQFKLSFGYILISMLSLATYIDRWFFQLQVNEMTSTSCFLRLYKCRTESTAILSEQDADDTDGMLMDSMDYADYSTEIGCKNKE